MIDVNGVNDPCPSSYYPRVGCSSCAHWTGKHPSKEDMVPDCEGCEPSDPKDFFMCARNVITPRSIKEGQCRFWENGRFVRHRQ